MNRKLIYKNSVDDNLHEKCAVFGVYAKNFLASSLVYSGLFSQQHRGQQASGIASTDNKKIFIHKSPGLVGNIFTKNRIKKLIGNIAIGHNRYSTSGGAGKHLQPVISKKERLVLVHNGTLPSVLNLKKWLKNKKIITDGRNDSELMHDVIEYYVDKGCSLIEAVRKSYPLFVGAFALLIMNKNKLIGMRDKCGIRPLSIGITKNEDYVFSSETCGLDSVNAVFLRDVKPGEMVVIDKNGLKSFQLVKGKDNLDIFELVYFARTDSILYGKKVDEVRRELGRELAREYKIKADIVISVPNTSIPAALGYAQESKIPFEIEGLLKNQYVHRTFISPSNRIRAEEVSMKFTAMPHLLKGKRVIVVDDSLVRGTTSKELVSMLKHAGVKEVHFLLAAPPIKYPDFYGIDTPDQKDLIATRMKINEIKDYIGADTLGYLSYSGMIKAIGLPEKMFCTSCFTGIYPIDIGENREKINFNI